MKADLPIPQPAIPLLGSWTDPLAKIPPSETRNPDDSSPVQQTGLLVELVRPGAKVPVRSTPDSAGLDLYYPGPGAVRLAPGERQAVPLGIKLAIPLGMVGWICPRSGLAVKQGVTVLNSPGVIDVDYRGEIHAVLVNMGKEPVQFTAGDRVAQLILVTAHALTPMQVPNLSTTARGDRGFGSTGR